MNITAFTTLFLPTLLIQRIGNLSVAVGAFSLIMGKIPGCRFEMNVYRGKQVILGQKGGAGKVNY